MSALSIPNIGLNSGHHIPQLGLGVYKVAPGETERIVLDAFEAGYRHIDTASFYGNEVEVGRAIAHSGIPREEIFVTTKLWNTDQPRPREAFEESLDRLGLERLDLFLIHWPQPERGEALGAWQALIEIADSGRSSSIGVSNFESEHLAELIDGTGIVPAVNQIEVHPLHQRRELISFCNERGIAVEAWGPLSQGKSDLLERTAITAAAEAHGKTPAQIVLRWHVQQGRIIFPKTSRPERLTENADIFDFALTEAEMVAIEALDEQQNFGPDPRSFNDR